MGLATIEEAAADIESAAAKRGHEFARTLESVEQVVDEQHVSHLQAVAVDRDRLGQGAHARLHLAGARLTAAQQVEEVGGVALRTEALLDVGEWLATILEGSDQ